MWVKSVSLCSFRYVGEEKNKSRNLGLIAKLVLFSFVDDILEVIQLAMQVCHVIINIQEGSRFDTQLLKKFRVLQASKQALSPYVRSQAALPLTSRSHSSSNTFLQPRSASSRGGGIMSRSALSVSLKSGGGSYTSLFPGQCNPVTLFVFLDDFSDMSKFSSSVDNSTTTSSVNDKSVNTGKLARSELPTKSSGSVVVFPRSKSDGGLRKKLQSSLEAQIRFLIKKCRTLTGSDISHVCSRSGSISSCAPLFSLDASKAVILLDRSTNKKGEALEFASSLVDDVLNGKANSDSLLLENNFQMSTKEDVLCVKEFIYRCSDILRGKGGLAANSSNAGVGMVAVAAAAAAASTSSRKTYSAPQLPQLDEWLSCSHQILRRIVTAKIVSTAEIDLCKKKSRERNMYTVKDEARSSKGPETLDIAVSLLGSGKGLNLKFSSLWCERALPAAKDMYLKDIPACYPTLVHETHLQKALCTFRSMVRGPSVQLFTKRLEDECISIWESGRQLCDATSLTGKPCVHQRHNIVDEEIFPGAEVKSHSSGYVFLHACACGRSRQLRCDPFDFGSANISFNCFPDCDKLLPSVKLPEIAHAGPIISSSWSLLRVGGSRYYEPSKGLLQSGFSAIQKFLLKLVLSSQREDAPNGLLGGDSEKASISLSNVTMTRTIRTNVDSALVTLEPVTRGESVGNGSSGDKKISFGKGLPNLLMRKPFSEVVAGSKSTDLLFPPLQPSRQPPPALEKIPKQKSRNGQSEESIQDACDQGCQESKDISRDPDTLGMSRGILGDDHILQNGNKVVPVNMKFGEKVMSNSIEKPRIAYIGFEHECPHGHRFLLNTEHLAKLGPLYSVPEEYLDSNSAESSNFKNDTSKLERNIVYGKGRRKTNRMAPGINRMKNMDRSNQVVSKDSIIHGKKVNRSSADAEPIDQLIHNHGANNQVNNAEDFGVAFSMLNRNLPIFMNCPHCSAVISKKDSSDIKYAGTISQLQRIFLVRYGSSSFSILNLS